MVPFTHEVPVDLHRPEGGGDGALIVALHGMGMNAEVFARDALPLVPDGASLLLPQGPLPFEVRRHEGMRQGNGWYVYTGENQAFLTSMGTTEAWLVEVIRTAVARDGFDPARVSLVGFSQGGYLAAYLGLRHPDLFRRLVVAAARIKHEALAAAARRAAAAGLRVLAVHGARDAHVSPDAARTSAEAIAALGVDVTFRTYACEHAVLRDPACRDDVRAFLA